MQDNILVALRGNRKRSIVAKDLNITTQMLGAIERGTRKPSRTLWENEIIEVKEAKELA